MIDFPEYRRDDEAKVPRDNAREEIGVRVIVGSMVLILGSLLGAGMVAFINWICDLLLGA